MRTTASTTRRILGISFYTDSFERLMERTLEGGLVVVPSAPVLVGLRADPAHREALESADLALTDSGFMVLLWRLFQREKIPRYSGLKYIRALFQEPDFQQPGQTFWVMPTAEDARANLAWLNTQGFTLTEADCYVAPMYPRAGPLEDSALLAAIAERRPRYVMLNLGGGVQERLGWFLRQALPPGLSPRPPTASPFHGSPSATVSPSHRFTASRLEPRPQSSDLSHPPTASQFHGIDTASRLETRFTASPFHGSPPAFICTGAAIAFLSHRQTNIPPWADRLMLGWLLRIMSEPTKFLPRYWHALRLVPLLWKYRDRSVAS